MLGGNKKGSKNKGMERSGGNTFIDNACKITGDISSKGDITIDGHIEGNVHSEAKILISGNGSILGNVTCKELDVYGKVEGDITTQTLYLKVSSVVRGKIDTRDLDMDMGADYHGSVSMTKNTTNTKSTVNDQKPNLVVDTVNK